MSWKAKKEQDLVYKYQKLLEEKHNLELQLSNLKNKDRYDCSWTSKFTDGRTFNCTTKIPIKGSYCSKHGPMIKEKKYVP